VIEAALKGGARLHLIAALLTGLERKVKEHAVISNILVNELGLARVASREPIILNAPTRRRGVSEGELSERCALKIFDLKLSNELSALLELSGVDNGPRGVMVAQAQLKPRGALLLLTRPRDSSAVQRQIDLVLAVILKLELLSGELCVTQLMLYDELGAIEEALCAIKAIIDAIDSPLLGVE
jgi:hypothetical protein